MSQLNNLVLLVRQALRDWRSDVEFAAFRAWMLRVGVRIDRSAIVRGVAGIDLAEGTSIGPHVVLSAGFSVISREVRAVPQGRIVLGRSFQARTGAIIATYGGEIIVGDNVSVNPYSILYGHGGLRIGNDVRIAAHTVIVPGNHRFLDAGTLIREQGVEMKGITIGNDVWLGAGVRVLDGVCIGDGAVVGAGSVVKDDVSPNSVVVGVPARVVSQRRSQEIVGNVRESVK